MFIRACIPITCRVKKDNVYIIVYYLGDNCIQNFHLGRVGNLVLPRRVSRTVHVISECISDDILPQVTILNMVIPILMHFCSLSLIGALEAA